MAKEKVTKNREIARALYLSGKSLPFIAELLDVSLRTVQGYKNSDAKSGKDWTTAKVQTHLSNAQKDSQSLFGDFVTTMYDQLKEIRENKNLGTKERIEAISRLGDSFSKMNRIAATENPEAYTHGIIKATIYKLIDIIKPVVSKECLSAIIEAIDQHNNELADVSI